MKKIFMIGNAHLDPVWLWNWQEGYSEVMATFRSALDRLEQFNDFVFTCSSACYYKWVEETDADMFEEIRRRVKEGRWVIAGGWWVQPDCNAPCGESFARQSLRSQRYYKEKFGITCSFGYNVDSFGHNAMLPQILKNSGMNNYVYMRPGPDEKEYPFENQTFMWQGADGTSLPTFRIPESYLTGSCDGIKKKMLAHREIAEKLDEPIMCFYGVGNHGGGPTVANINTIHGVMEKSGADDFCMSSPDKFFDYRNNFPMPTLEGDLQHHASGCYTAYMRVKELNRKAEAALISAEKMVSIAEILGFKIRAELDDAWETLLFNQFHDILGGCCIKSALEDACTAFEYCIHTAETVKNRAQQKIAWNIDTSNGKNQLDGKMAFMSWEIDKMGTPFIIFNPNSREEEIAVDLSDSFSAVTDNGGNYLPSQVVRNEVTAGERESRSTRVVAKIPSMGWKLLWAYKEKENKYESKGLLSTTENHIENDWFKIDIANGKIAQITDKKSGKKALSGSIGALVMDDEDYDTWAHQTQTFNKQVGEFAFDSVSVFENGEVSSTVILKGSYNKSEITINLTIYRNIPNIKLSYKVDWREKHKILKLSFPTSMQDGIDVDSIPFGHIKRTANGKEQPMLNWVCLENETEKFGIATNSRAAYSAENNEIRITALRSPIYADHFGERFQNVEYTEQGLHYFNISLIPFAKSYTEIDSCAELLKFPVSIIKSTYHKGNVPAVYAGVYSPQGINITAFKISEDTENAYVIRINETEGKPVSGEITINGLNIKIPVSLKTNQVKTYKISCDKVQEVNFLEY